VQSLGLEKVVTFLGPCDDVVDIINTLDLFVLPSLHEGTPTVILEAMFLGLPVVASATGGISEVVRDRWNGLLVEPGNRSNLASACLSLLSNPALAQVVTRNACQASKAFLRQETCQLLLSMYSSLYRDGTGGKAEL
ncbi:MAG: glycosyltransferase, partial [Bacteroidota bacterium]